MDHSASPLEGVVKERRVENRPDDKLDFVDASRFSRRPLDRSSMTTKRSTNDCFLRARHRLAPMNPAPPVTTTFIYGVRSKEI